MIFALSGVSSIARHKVEAPSKNSEPQQAPRWLLNALELARSIVNVLEEKKGEDILLLDLKDIASFTDYFVLCNGTSDRMLDALARTVVDSMRQQHKKNECDVQLGVLNDN